MSNQYKIGDSVPSEILCARLREIVHAITAGDGGKSILRECVMRVPAEIDRDADLVISGSARRIEALTARVKKLEDCLQYIIGERRIHGHVVDGIVAARKLLEAAV